MAKKSFFEKLTGVDEDTDKIGPKPRQQDSIKKVDLKKEKKSPAKSKKNNSKSKSKPGPKKTNTKTKTKLEQDWSSEEEGQLTIDVYQTNNNIIVKSTIAGVSAENLDISIANDMLTIKGIRRKEKEILSENYYYQELYWGPFSRSIILPSEVDTSKIEASIKDGILTIKLPKKKSSKAKTIKVKEED